MEKNLNLKKLIIQTLDYNKALDITIIDLEGKTKPIKEVIKNLTKEIKPIAESLGSLNRLNELENIFKSDNMVENMRNFHKKESLDGLVKELQKILKESLDNPIL